MSAPFFSVDSARAKAKKRLPKMVYDFLEGGALDERTLHRNRHAFAESSLKQHIMVDISKVDTSTQVLGTDFALPVAVSPMGLQTVLHPDADAAVARAANAAGSVFIHSPWSGCSIEEIYEASHGRMWSQVAFWEDRSVSDDHISRAKAAGIDTLVIAGDVAVSSKRERDIVHGTGMPPRPPLADVFNVMMHPGWLIRWVMGRRITWGSYKIDGRRIKMGEMDDWMSRHGTYRATWQDVAELRARWSGKLVVKGIMCPEDAKLALAAGVDGVFVSNHGGRQFDGQPATLDVVAQVADAVAGKAEVILDGGVRRGSDIVTALGQGADLVAAGRPFAYGLAAAGEHGVHEVFNILADELATAMRSVGVPDVAALGAG